MSRFEFSLVITHQQFLGNYCIQFLDIMMKGFLLWTVIFAIIALSYAELNLHPLSDEFINSINNKNTTWKAGQNFDISFPLTQLKKLSGVLPKGDHVSELPLKIHSEKAEEIPESFDAREAWPHCTSIIGDIQDQGSCGSCWAFGAVETMSDRICIHSNGTIKVTLSAEDLLDCCECGGGCEGGYNDLAWQYYGNRGIVTGGKYGSTDGCKAYSIKPCDHRVDGLLGPCEEEPNPTPACKKECDSDSLDYKSDLRKGTSYTIDASVTQIQTEIMTNGPVEADYDVYEDFFSYKSGVYQHVAGEYNSKHAIKIIGWGVEDGTPYWLIVNSWNENWGEKGYFKMLRGEDECGIESDIFAGMPIF